MKTNPHNTEGLTRPCERQDLFLVSEGVQCGNCLALVVDNRLPTLTAEDIRRETLVNLSGGFYFGGHLWHVGQDELGFASKRDQQPFREYAVRHDAVKDLKEDIIRSVEADTR